MKVVGLMTLSLMGTVSADCPIDSWYAGKDHTETDETLFFQVAAIAKSKAKPADVWVCKVGGVDVCKSISAGEAACAFDEKFYVKNTKTELAAKLSIADATDDSGKEWGQLSATTDLVKPGDAGKFECQGDTNGKKKGYFTLKVLKSLVKGKKIKFDTTFVDATACKQSADGTSDAAACTPANILIADVGADGKFKLGTELEGCGGVEEKSGGGCCAFPCGTGWIIVYIVGGVLVVGGIIAAVLLMSGDDEDDDDDDDEEEDDKDDDE